MKSLFKKKHKPMSTEDAVLSIEKALRSGHALHTFRSGGGLQVARIEKVERGARRGDLKGYGEHPHINEALRHAGEDFAAGGRPYSEVYGTCNWDEPKKSKEGIYPMYLTGTHEADGRLDQWVKQGTFDARGTDDGQIEVELRGWGEMHTPDDIVQRVTKTGVKESFADHRGNEYECSRTYFANGKPGCTTTPTKIDPRFTGKNQHRLWMWHTKQVGRGPGLIIALNVAFDAKVEESEDD